MTKRASVKVAAILILTVITALLLTACFGTKTVIKFDSNGGSPCESITVEDGTESIELPTTIKDGYVFLGWYANRAMTELLPDTLTGENIPKNSITFYAKWQIKSITLTFTAGDETVGTLSVDYNSVVTTKDFPSLENFPGYYWEETNFTATYDRTFSATKAVTEEPDYSIVYRLPKTTLNGEGEVVTSFTEYARRAGKAGTAVSAPLKPGSLILTDPVTKVNYSAFFDGWYYDEEYTRLCVYAPTEIANGDTVLYAKYVFVGDDSKYLFYVDIPGGIAITGFTVVGAYQSFISVPSEINGERVLSIGLNGVTHGERGLLASDFLERIIIPETVTFIGDYAFYGSNALKEVVFVGDAVTSIGKGAFAGCGALETFHMPDNVTAIGDYAFASIAGEDDENPVEMSLSSVEIGPASKLSTMGDYAFYGCEALESVTFGTTMREFNYLAFFGSGLKNVDFHSGGVLVGKNGAVYSRSGAILHYYPICGEAEFDMPLSVTSVAPYAFYRNEKIERVNLSPNLASIGDAAFYGCSQLKDVNFASSALKTIGAEAFYECKALTSASFPDRLTSVDSYAFYRCEAMTTATFTRFSALAEVGDYAFYECKSVGSILIPTEVTRVGDYAFCGCKALSYLQFGSRSKLTSVGQYAFYDCTAIGSVLLPSGISEIEQYAFASSGERMRFEFDNDTDLGNITRFGDYAFMNTGITSVTISGRIASDADFGTGVFKNCTSLQQAYFAPSGYSTVPKELFYGCTSLTRITFSSNVVNIGDYAFYNCSSMEYATFGNSVRNIGDSSFEGCIALTNQGSERRVLPVNLVSLGDRAFYNCKNLTAVNIPAGLTALSKECFARCEKLTDINYDEGAQLHTIGENAFAYCIRLERAALPATLAKRNEDNTSGLVGNPFYGCESLTDFVFAGSTDGTLVENGGVIYRKLDAIGGGLSEMTAIYAYPTSKSTAAYTVPTTVAAIDPYAFYGCILSGLSFAKNTPSAGIENVTLVSVGAYAFAYTRVTAVNLSYRVYEVGDYAFYGSAMNSLNIDSDYIYDGKSGYAIVNNDTDKPNNLLTVGDYAFASVAIPSVTVPERVCSLGEGALAYDYSLSSVKFDSANFYTPLTLGGRLFAKDNLIREITVPGHVTDIGDYAFAECGNLETVTFAVGTENLRIGNYAFSKVQYLYQITLPSRLESLGVGVFEGDTRLKYVNFPSELGGRTLEIPERAFEAMPTLTEITLPAYVSGIGAYAFSRTSLKKITFLGTAENSDFSIGEYAFAGLGLKEINLPANLTEIGVGAFENSLLESVTYGSGKNFTIGASAFRNTKMVGFSATDRVTEIGEYAFADNLDMTSFTAAIVDIIPKGAFDGNVKLSAVSFGNGVKRIEAVAFRNTAVTTLNSSAEYIGSGAFYGSLLTEISVVSPRGLEVADVAFAGASGLRTVRLEAAETISVGDNVFALCSKITVLGLKGQMVNLAEGFATGATSLGDGFDFEESSGTNFTFIAEDKVLYSADMKKFFYYPAGKEGSIYRITPGITSIADYAFYGNNGLTAVIVTDAEVTVGANSFAETDESLVIFVPADLVDDYKNDWQMDNIDAKTDVAGGFVLGESGGGEYTVLEYLGTDPDIVINNEITDNGTVYNVTAIGENAFKNNTVIRSVVIGSGIKTVFGHAFDGCVDLTTVFIGENVTSIKSYAFYNCTSLSSVTYSAESSLISIGNYAFANAVKLTEIVVPEGVETLGIYAYANCIRVEDVVLGEGLIDIGNNAFEGCKSLISIRFPASVSRLGSYVMSDCENLVYMEIANENVCSISANTFNGTPTGLYFFVPTEAAVKSYKSDTVWRAYVARIVSSEERSTVNEYKNYVLTRNLDGYTLVAYLGTDTDVNIISDLGDGVKITAIGEYAIGKFATTVTVGEGIKEISARAFFYAENLTTVNLPSTLVSVGGYAFAYLNKLTTVNITDDEPEYTVTEIPKVSGRTLTLIDKPDDSDVAGSVGGTVATLTSGVKVEVANSSRLTDIGAYAFCGCENLTGITIPESVRSIGDFAFYGCNGMTDVTFNHGKAAAGKASAVSSENVIRDTFYFRSVAFNQNTGRNDVYFYKYEHSETVNLAIGRSAFADNPVLKTLEISCRVTFIGAGAFAGCEEFERLYLRYRPKSITEDAVPATTASVFDGCDKLCVFLPTTEVNSKYKNVWTNAYDKHRLTVVEYADDRGFVYAITSGSSSNRQVTVVNYFGTETEVVFPSTANIGQQSYNVTRIGWETYGGDNDVNGYVIGKNVTKVTIPSSVLIITQDAFRNSANLREVELSSGLRTIESYAFAGCEKLTNIVIPTSVESIEPYAFYGCKSLNSGLRIPENPGAVATLTIGGYAFAECTSLESFYVPNQVATLGSVGATANSKNGHIFDGCTSLKTVTFSQDATVRQIAGYAFAHTAIKEITLPESLETLSDYAFADSYDLQRVYVKRDISAGVTSITAAGSNIFNGIDNPHLKIYVPVTSFDQYATSGGWMSKTVIKGGAENITSDGLFAFETEGSGENMTVTLTDYRGTEETVVIPRTVYVQERDCYVTMIGSYFGNATMKKVVFDGVSQVDTIMAYAFADCTALEEIKLPDRVTVQIGPNETGVIANGVKTLGKYAFSGCVNLTDITLSSQINTITEHAFVGCVSLREITLPAGVEKVESSAFSGCTSLARVKVEFGAKVNEGNVGNTIGNSVFEKAGMLPGGLTIIVSDDKAAIFRSGWNAVADNICPLSEVVGDYVVRINDYGTALTIVQYLGSEQRIDLTTLTLKGLKVEAIMSNAVASEETVFIIDETIVYYGEGVNVEMKTND